MFLLLLRVKLLGGEQTSNVPLEVLQWVLASLCGKVDVLLEHTQGQVLFKLECKLTSNKAVWAYFSSVCEWNLKNKTPFLKFWQFMTISQLSHWSLHFYGSLKSSDMTAIQDVNLYSCTTDRILTHKQNRFQQCLFFGVASHQKIIGQIANSVREECNQLVSFPLKFWHHL